MITSIKEYRKFNESAIKQDKEKDIFNYRSEISDLWNLVIKKAQEFQHINFDLENNESLKEKKTIYVKKDLRKGQPIKYEFNVELCAAGGDWESPVIYFKIEFTHEYFFEIGQKLATPEFVWDLQKDNSFSNDHFVIIPDDTQGNHLDKTEKGFTAKTDSNFKTAQDKDKKIAWKWIEQLLTKLVDDRHKMIDDDRNTEISEPDSESIKESATKQPIKEKELVNLALGIALICNGEYGQTYWNKETNTIYVCLGDSHPFGNTDELATWIKEMFIDYEFYDLVKVIVENESGPDGEETGWFVFNDKDKFIPYKN